MRNYLLFRLFRLKISHVKSKNLNYIYRAITGSSTQNLYSNWNTADVIHWEHLPVL